MPDESTRSGYVYKFPAFLDTFPGSRSGSLGFLGVRSGRSRPNISRMAWLRKLPSGNWSAQIDRQGVRTSQTWPTKAQAQAWATKIEAEILAKARGQIIRRSLRDALQRSKEGQSHRNQVRLDFFAQSLPFVDKWLEDVRPADFAEWRDRQLQGLKSSSVNRDLNQLQGVLTRCVEWGWLHKNPLSGLKRPKDPPPRNRVITWREAKAVLRALGWKRRRPETLQQEVGFAFLLALHTAMRANEILCFELRGSVAHLPKTKNGDPRDVPLSRRSRRLVELCYPFRLSISSLDALFRKARRNAGLSGFTFHDARATATTRLSKTVDILMLARITGHRDPKQLMTYYRTTPQEIADRLR